MNFSDINANYVNDWIAFIDGMIFSSNLVRNSEINPPKRKRAKLTRREKFVNIDYTKTTWGMMIRNSSVKFPDNRFGEQFRRRFRVSFQLYEILVDICRDQNIFGIKNTARIKIPIKSSCFPAYEFLDVTVAAIRSRKCRTCLRKQSGGFLRFF